MVFDRLSLFHGFSSEGVQKRILVYACAVRADDYIVTGHAFGMEIPYSVVGDKRTCLRRCDSLFVCCATGEHI